MTIVWYIVIGVLAWRLFAGRWPWERKPLSGRSPAEEQARALLGLREGASHAEIIEAHRKLVSLVHPDRGGTNEQVHEANAARDLLLASLAARNRDLQ